MKTVTLATIRSSGTIGDDIRRASLMRDSVAALEQCHSLLLRDYPGTPGKDQPVAPEVSKLFDQICEVLARTKAEGHR
jgi:hypothetical protein